ncbi:MAG: ATP-binding protein [Burkholderiales bacterium]
MTEAAWKRAPAATRAALLDWAEHAGEPLVAVDRDGRVRVANPAFARVFAVEPRAVVGLSVARFVPLLAAPRFGRWLDEAAGSPSRVHRLLAEAHAADGDRFLVAATVLRVRDAGARDAAGVVALRPLDTPRGLTSRDGDTTDHTDTVALGPLLDAVCRAVDDPDARRRCRLVLHDADERIAADADAVRAALLRLVDNACRHADPGAPIALRTRIEHCEPADGLPGGPQRAHVVVTVADRGRGLTRAQLQRAFEPFGLGALPGAGAGLGLATARELVEAQRGWIELRSTTGVGTEAEVWLPAATR